MAGNVYHRAVIIGVGLLGGSIGKALRERQLADYVLGYGRSTQKLDLAVSQGAIDGGEQDLARACEKADLVVVCTPVQRIVDDVRQAAKYVSADALITDVGSTKAEIVRCLADCPNFCGAHPLAGSEKSGVEFSDSQLFQGRTTVLTPADETSASIVGRNDLFWKSLGCNTLTMTAADHDLAVAATSHLPHLLAAALASSTDQARLPLAGAGWRDTTRVAAGNIEMWLQIVQENQGPVLDALRKFSESLESWSTAIAEGDWQRLEELLKKGKHIRDSVGN